MKQLKFALTILMLAGSIYLCPLHVQSQTANKSATEATRKLLSWMNSLPQRDNKKLLSGQFCGYPNPQPQLLATTHPWSTFRQAYMDDVFKMTGKYPAIMGVDYYGNTGGINEAPGIVTTEHSHLRTLNYNDISGTGLNINKELIKWWRAGGLVTINIHSYRPDTHQPNNSGSMMKFGKGGGDKRYPPDERFKEYDLSRILPGGADRSNWIAMMDGMALGLTELRDSGVVVIWRPFHEMNSGFWWGKHNGELFKAVWHDMFTYFCNKKELNNLIWAFTGSWEFYPGNEYVDITGIDVYSKTISRQEQLPGSLYVSTLKENKLFAVTEFGFGIDSLRDNSIASYDFQSLLTSLKANVPKSVYFLVWSDAWRIGNPNHTNQAKLMNDSWIINRDDIDVKIDRTGKK